MGCCAVIVRVRSRIGLAVNDSCVFRKRFAQGPALIASDVYTYTTFYESTRPDYPLQAVRIHCGVTTNFKTTTA